FIFFLLFMLSLNVGYAHDSFDENTIEIEAQTTMNENQEELDYEDEREEDDEEEGKDEDDEDDEDDKEIANTAATTTAATTPSIFSQGIKVDLRNPSYSDGVLTTTCGGVLTGPDIRIQAMNITYTKKTIEGKTVYEVIAEGKLQIEFGEYVFVGDRLDYDFTSKSGVIYNGRTMVEPWFFGGEYIYLQPDSSYHIFNAFITTSPSDRPDILITSDEANLCEGRFLTARNVKFKLFDVPLFWIPSFNADLDSIFDSPIRYSVKWGSRQGHRFSMAYELFSWRRWKTFLRLDYRIKRGLGGGVETYYSSLDEKTTFESINYVARDSSIIHPKQRFRYRFQGIGNSLLLDEKISVHLSYDKISDIDMPTDYNDRGLELDTAGRTELLMRRQEDAWISNFITRVRINAFQTLKQELPTFETSWRPFNLANTGIVADNVLKVSYLDFVYGNNQLYHHGYSSSRIELAPLFYRHFKVGQVNVTPEAGGVLIAYSNSPGNSAKYLTLGKFSCNINTDIWRYYNHQKHVITPYVQYDYFTCPTVSPNDHYIFDIEDGWYRLDMMQFGVAQSLYNKQCNGLINRSVYANLYANAFFDTHTFPQVIPKVYADVVFNSFSYLRHSFNTAWNFNQNLLDFFNVRTDWTVNADIAMAIEYRHRSSFDWRKADHTNFIIDSFRSVSRLRHSQLSDRRDTLLFHIFYRFHPCWAFEFESRHGWNRLTEPSYNEFEIDLLGRLPSALNFKLSYQHREDDDRLSVYMSIGMKRPDFGSPCNIVPFLGF
nr:hypothetical protein [Parachlamydiaceae bacterium]